MKKIICDCETRSEISLPKTNAHVYAEDMSTCVLCFAYKVNSLTNKIWINRDIIPHEVVAQRAEEVDFETFRYDIETASTLVAYNAEFERAILEKTLGIKTMLNRWRDVAAVAAYYALPRGLGALSQYLSCATVKDDKGHKVMMKLCKPRRHLKADKAELNYLPTTVLYHGGAEDFQILCDYNITDVETTDELDRLIKTLPVSEREYWLLDQEANEGGVRVDIALASRLISLRDDYLKAKRAEFYQITALEVSQTVAFRRWLDQKKCTVGSVNKTEIKKLLASSSTPLDVRRACELRALCGKSSLKKMDASLKQTSSDGRMRSLLVYSRAITHRWGGRGMQVQNLPSNEIFADVEPLIALVRSGASAEEVDMLSGDLVKTLMSCIRGVIVADEGSQIFSVDFSSIEGRVLAFLAGDYEIVNEYVKGTDMYKLIACEIFQVSYEEVTKWQRKVGKIPELACGYGGSWRAFINFAENNGVKPPQDVYDSLVTGDYYHTEADGSVTQLTEDEAAYKKWATPIVRAWRRKRKITTLYWQNVESCAVNALKDEGSKYTCRGMTYQVVYLANRHKCLVCSMSDGTKLFYHKAELTKRGRIRYYTNKANGKWDVAYTHGGKLVENIVQAYARKLMAEAWRRVRERVAGARVNFTVHDELVGNTKGVALDRLVDIMEEVPEWAKGLPIAVEGWLAPRFGK